MFEDEDWNINEDDLNDFNSDDIFKENEKAQNLLLTKNAKTQKKTAVTLNTCKLKCNVSDNLQNNVVSQPIIPVSQKKVVLDIFKSSSNSQDALRIDQNHSLNLENEPFECIPNEKSESRKNLILNVFQERIAKPKPIVKSVLKMSENHENKLKRKKNVAFLDSSGENNTMKKLRTEQVNISQEILNDMLIDQENKILAFESSNCSTGDANNSKKQILIDLLNSKTAKVSCVKQAVIRKFPGPAGILPDDVGENEVIDLDSLDENKNNKSNQYADICSQNTKNLFTTGGWQLMMDDLPADFELYDIATIKENALQYSKTYKKVPYLAGIVQYIDYKPNDPHIILKDLSGKVDARIHHSICKLYPNALGTSTVILAKDVGLIVTSKKFVCVIISLNNLVSIYSDDMRLVETPHLKTLHPNDSTNCNLHESQITVLDETECVDNNQICKTHSQEINNSLQQQQQQPGLITKDTCNMEKVKDINCKDTSELKAVREDTDTNKYKKDNIRNEPEATDYNCDMDEFEFNEDDSWLGVNIDELNTFKPHQFPSSTPMDIHDNSIHDVRFQIKNLKNVESKESKHHPELGKMVSGSKQLLTKNHNYKTISHKLLPFRNTNDTPRHDTISKQIGSNENIASITNKRFECEGNDTDDEMLSQLDVDAIAASYSTQNC